MAGGVPVVSPGQDFRLCPPGRIGETLKGREPQMRGGDVMRAKDIISRRDILRAMVRGDDVLAAEVQHRLDEYASGHRWSVAVDSGVAHVTGAFTDDTEQAIVAVLARTVPGVAAVEVTASRPA